MNYQNNKTETSVIQLALKRAGFLDGEIDGIFGSDTRNAVIAFQKAASLSPDGIVGPKTYAALLPYLKGYTIHRVKKGDSLYSIAAIHNTSIRKIMLANPTVDPLNLQIGTILTVPFDFSVELDFFSASFSIFPFRLSHRFTELYCIANKSPMAN